MKPFLIYRSSAGSGKTRALAKQYLLLALRSPEYFKYIMAVTFTNKSTQEMKDRIIRYLVDFAAGKEDSLSGEIMIELSLSRPELIQKSELVLSNILHSYSQFAISTIDAFFQRVIRSFTRESGLLGNFRLEIDQDLVMTEVIAELMDELGPDNPELTQWVIDFSSDKLQEGKSWNINEALKQFAKEIFREEFKVVEQEILSSTNRISGKDFLSLLRKERKALEKELHEKAKHAMDLLAQHGITSQDFNGKERGNAYAYFKKVLAEGWTDFPTTITIQKALDDATAWADKKSFNKNILIQLAADKLIPILLEMKDEKKVFKYESIKVVEKNFYSFGLIADITRKLKTYKAANNIMLLADAPQFLNGVINNSDTPFIYEKVGSFFKHYLIDEFQDTSSLQWQNFDPLVRDALDQNHRSMIVGDVKQSVYRWRGGDLELLQSKAKISIGEYRSEEIVLNKNFRSAAQLVDFNNKFFATASQLVSDITERPLPREAFADGMQQVVKSDNGYVQISFLDKNSNAEEDDDNEDSDTDEELTKLPAILEELQSKNIPLSDIAILVRKNEEGQRIASYLLAYKNSPKAKEGFLYDVVSNETLRIDSAASILLLISALKNIDNPDDKVARGELVYEYNQHKGNIDTYATIFSSAGFNQLDKILPSEYLERRESLIKLSLFELTETLIEIFEIGSNGEELAYLQAFQDLVLEFSQNEKNDLASFLEWWEENKVKKSIQVAGNNNAATIYSIHKSKGLQFRFVIIPFCSWKLDHEIPPLLWCKTNEPPFDQMGHLAVKYSSKLKKSFFKEEYERELSKSFLDNLNLLYVALTRAEEGMILFAPKHKPGKSSQPIKTVGDLLYITIKQSELSHHFDLANEVFQVGEIKSNEEVISENSISSLSLNHYNTNDWRRKLVIKKEGSSFFSDTTEQQSKVNHGLLMHRALSLIQTKENVDEVLTQLNREGIIQQDELTILQLKINQMMMHPIIGSWFTHEWQVKTEIPIITLDGKQARPDRVIIKNSSHRGTLKQQAIVIDFKTGVKNNSHRKQVEDYSFTLSQMGYVDVEAFLLYIETMEVLPVVSKMNLNLF